MTMSRRPNRELLWLVTTVCLMCCRNSSATAVEPLRWKFSAGENFVVETTQDMTLKAVEHQELSANAHQSATMRWDVRSVSADGVAAVSVKLERIQMKLEAPTIPGWEYDSATEESPTGMAAIVTPLFDAMMAGQFEFTVTALGEVSELQLADETLAAIKNSPGVDDANVAAAIGAVKAMITRGIIPLPEEAPTEGQEWTSRVEVNNPALGNTMVETKYRYEGTKEVDGTPCAVIRPTLRTELIGGEARTVKVNKHQSKGDILFDLDAGRLRSIWIEQKLSVEMTVAGEKLPGSIEQQITATMKAAER